MNKPEKGFKRALRGNIVINREYLIFSLKQVTSGSRSFVYDTVAQVAANIFAITHNEICHSSRVEPSEKKMKSLEAWSNI